MFVKKDRASRSDARDQKSMTQAASNHTYKPAQSLRRLCHISSVAPRGTYRTRHGLLPFRSRRDGTRPRTRPVCGCRSASPWGRRRLVSLRRESRLGPAPPLVTRPPGESAGRETGARPGAAWQHRSSRPPRPPRLCGRPVRRRSRRHGGAASRGGATRKFVAARSGVKTVVDGCQCSRPRGAAMPCVGPPRVRPVSGAGVPRCAKRLCHAMLVFPVTLVEPICGTGRVGSGLSVTKLAFCFVQVLPLAACFNVNGFAPTSLRTSSFRASNDAAVNTKPALAMTPKARAGRAPVSVRPSPSLCKCAGPCHAHHVLACT